MDDNAGVEQPELKVVKGEPTAEELAAVVTAVTGQVRRSGQQAGSGRPGRPDAREGWAAYWRQVRRPIQPGRNAWRRSGLPG